MGLGAGADDVAAHEEVGELVGEPDIADDKLFWPSCSSKSSMLSKLAPEFSNSSAESATSPSDSTSARARHSSGAGDKI